MTILRFSGSQVPVPPSRRNSAGAVPGNDQASSTLPSVSACYTGPGRQADTAAVSHALDARPVQAPVSGAKVLSCAARAREDVTLR
jgi:hypothetical protein